MESVSSATLWKSNLPKETVKVRIKCGAKIPFRRENVTAGEDIPGAEAEVAAEIDVAGTLDATAIETVTAIREEGEETTRVKGGEDLGPTLDPSRRASLRQINHRENRLPVLLLPLPTDYLILTWQDVF